MSNTKIPEGWQKVALGEFMEFKNGINADKSAYGQGTKFVNVMDVFRNSFLKKDDIAGKVQISDKQRSEYSVIHGDILFNRTSETREEIAYSTVYTGKETVTFGGFVIRGRQKRNLLLPDFAGYCFKNSATRKEMIRRSQGAVRANIGQKDLNKISILVPPKHEQEKIVQILSRFDTAIEKTEALITAKQKQFEWLIEVLISKRQYSMDWNKSTLGDLFDIYTYSSKSRLVDITGKRIIVDMGSISRKGNLIANKRTNSNQDLLQTYDLVMPKDDIGGGNIIGKVAIIALSGKFVCGDHVYRLVQKRKNNAHFLKFLINCNAVNRQLRARANGTSQLGLSKQDVLKQQVWIPSLTEQEHIANTLKTAHSELTSLEQLVKQYHVQKRGLMQKLLTGQWKTRL